MKRSIGIVILLVMGICFNSETVNAQNPPVTGTVYDVELDTTMPAATIFIPNTTIGTTSDGNGEYTLDIGPDSQDLRCQFIGYQPQIKPDIEPGSEVDWYMGIDDFGNFVIVDIIVREPQKQ